MDRLNSGADVVLNPLAVEALISAAEDGVANIGLTGSKRIDGRGPFYEVTGTGAPEVGASVMIEEGGTEPGDRVLSEFRSSFSEGVLIVLDPYGGEFAVYVVDQDSVEVAKAVMSE